MVKPSVIKDDIFPGPVAGSRSGQPASMTPAPVAAIDLGSNTVRLLAAKVQGNEIGRFLVRQETSRLGQGLRPGRPFLPRAVERTWKVLEDYRRSLSALGVNRVLVGATMAVRQALDGRGFLARIEREIGFETMMLTGSQEAELTAAGVMTALAPIPEESLIFDLGGRSTEFILASRGHVRKTLSLELGAVDLTETYLDSDPPREEELAAMQAEVSEVLAQALSDWPEKVQNQRELVGTAGTVTTLAAMAQGLKAYNPELINNFRLDRGVLHGLFRKMMVLPGTKRAMIPGLPKDRADIIIAGAIVTMEIINFFETTSLVASDAGLLEGLWLVAAGRRSI